LVRRKPSGRRIRRLGSNAMRSLNVFREDISLKGPLTAHLSSLVYQVNKIGKVLNNMDVVLGGRMEISDDYCRFYIDSETESSRSFFPTIDGTDINIGAGWWLCDGRHQELITGESLTVTATGYVIFQASRSNPATWSFINQASAPDMTSATHWEFPLYQVTLTGATLSVDLHYQTSSIYASGV